MSAADIFIPSGGSLAQLSAFTKQLSELPEKDEFLVSAEGVSFLRPTCMIMIAKACRTRGRKYKDETLKYRGLEKLSYANNLGFSDALNLKGQPFPQRAFGSEHYIPLSVMSKDALEEAATELFLELGDIIEYNAPK